MVKAQINSLVPFYPDIRYSIEITDKTRGLFNVSAPHYLVFGSEEKDGSHENIGCIGQQLDLFFACKKYYPTLTERHIYKTKWKVVQRCVFTTVGSMKFMLTVKLQIHYNNTTQTYVGIGKVNICCKYGRLLCEVTISNL